MKTKRSRKDYSEEESDEPAQSWPQRKSDSDMFESSDEEVSKKSKKRRKKRESSSESESDASDKDAHKKRKHKKKKRKHSKKKRKDASSDDSESESDASSDESEEDSPVVVKKRHKHKHRHSGKHSKKRRHDSDRDVYPEKVSVSSERLVPSRATTSHKIKSVCLGKEQRQSSVENIVSSEEEQPRKRVDRREETDRNPVYKGRPEIKDVVDRQRVKHHPPRPQLAAQLLSKKGTEPPGPYYKDAPRTSQKDKFPAPPRERAYEAGKSRPDQYYDKNRDAKPREDRPKEERVRDPRSKVDIRPPRDDQPRDVQPRDIRQRDMRPRDDRPRDDRPRDDRPRDDRPRDDRPKDDRPRDDRPKDDRPRDDRPKDDRPRDDRPKDDKLRDYSHKFPDNNYNRYGENRQTFDRNGGNKYQNEEQREERYSGQSNPNFRGSRDNHNQGSVTREEANRPGTEGYNNRRGNNYQGQNYQRDNQRQDGGYEKNNDYHNPRNDQRGNNRFQEKGDYSAGNQNTRRFDGNERKPAVKREHSTSSIRDIKQERRSDSRRLGSKERPPRTEYKREEREESGATARSRPSRSRASPERDDGKHEWGKRGAGDTAGEEDKPPGDRDKPNFGLSGKLTEDRNTVNGVVLKYTEPPEARQPKRRWRFYPFKGDKALSILYIHRQSCFLLGRDRKVADIPLDHPSVSKQHAALQYRLVPFTRDDGSRGKRVRPYIIDLGSANGTFVNNKRIDPSKYVELLERDVVKFGFSQREYVLLHENSKDDGMDDDDVKQTGGASDEGKARLKEEHSN